MCSHPTSKPPVPNPTLVGTKISPADAGDHPRTAIAYVGVKKRTDQRAIIKPRPARQVNKTLRFRSSLTGMTGSLARVSTQRNIAKNIKLKGIGHSKMSGDARLKSSETTDNV